MPCSVAGTKKERPTAFGGRKNERARERKRFSGVVAFPAKLGEKSSHSVVGVAASRHDGPIIQRNASKVPEREANNVARCAGTIIALITNLLNNSLEIYLAFGLGIIWQMFPLCTWQHRRPVPNVDLFRVRFSNGNSRRI